MASDTISVQRGQTLSIPVTFYEDSGETPIDLSSAEVTVRQAYPSVLSEASITVIDAVAGVVLLETTEQQSDRLRSGRVNWFRLEVQFEDATNRVTPPIWISVQ